MCQTPRNQLHLYEQQQKLDLPCILVEFAQLIWLNRALVAAQTSRFKTQRNGGGCAAISARL